MKNLSIQYRISVYTGLCVLATIVAFSGFSLYQSNQTNAAIYQASSQTLSEELQQQVKINAQEQARRIQGVLDDALTSARTLATIFSAPKRADSSVNTAIELDRAQMNGMMYSVLDNNPNLLGVFTVWEPDALDGLDRNFVNDTAMGSDASGRFVPYWYRDGAGKIVQEPLVGYESQTLSSSGIREGEYYLCSKDSKRECVTDPISYEIDGKMVLMISLVAPIIAQREFYGMAGVDIQLDFVQQLASKLSASLYGGEGDVLILTNNGTIAADSSNADRLGKNLQSYSVDQFDTVKAVQKSKQSRVDLDATGQFVQVTAPLQIGRSEATWSVLIKVPIAVVEAKAGQLKSIMTTAQNKSIFAQLVLGAALIAIALVLILWMARSITEPLKKTVARLKDLAEGEGDLTHRLDVSRNDECGQVAESINQLLDKLQKMILNIVDNADKVSASAKQSSQISAVASNGITGQRTQLDFIASAVTEMSTAAQEVAQHAEQAAEAAETTDGFADSGKKIVGETATCIHALANEVESASTVISRLEGNAKDIGGILDVIRSVAEQTNLLALNAAIEAARAGEQGRGFAVVADEVRVLAQRTQNATTEIHQKIETLQNGTQEAVKAMRRGRSEADRSVESAKSAAQALNEIKTSVAVIAQMNAQIANAASEQRTVAEEISRNVNELGSAADEVADAAQQAEQASLELNGLADELKHTTKQFKTG